ncbi:MAG: hypothetical protein HKN47_09555 [Pirellulaceae bacterium]|nr:hypothetical protein [Pirellulaceae bacterium]
MSDEFQAEFLRQRAEDDRQMLADPITYLQDWSVFAWETDDLNPQTATYRRLPAGSLRSSDRADADQVSQWLSAIDQSSYERYPAREVENLDHYVAHAVEPLAQRVRRGITSARLNEPITDNGPYLAATLLSRKADERQILFNDAQLFLDVLDLSATQRYEWFGDSIDDSMIFALSHILVGQTQPIVDRVADTGRSDIDRASLIAYFPVSVWNGYLNRDDCIQILRDQWECLSQQARDSDGTEMLKMAIFDAACLLSLPDSHPLMQQATSEGIENFALSPKSARTCREKPEEADEILRRKVIQYKRLTDVIEQGGQFNSTAIRPKRPAAQSKVTHRSATDTALPTPSITATGASDRVGRNDTCPCGSGKKYKKCCMRNQ